MTDTPHGWPISQKLDTYTLDALKAISRMTISNEAVDEIYVNGHAHELLKDNLDSGNV